MKRLKRNDRVRVRGTREPFKDMNILFKIATVVGKVGKNNYLVIEFDDGSSCAIKESNLEVVEE